MIGRMLPRPARSRRLGRDRSGVAMTEFALCLPLMVTLVMYGMEMVHFAFAAQKVGDIATLSADSISRIRAGISEGDVTETLTGVASLGGSIDFAQNGRIIVSSVMPVMDASGNTVTNQKIRWQRCYGSLTSSASGYGAQDALLGTEGIGPAGPPVRKVAAIAGSELIFVEVAYVYQPLISNALFGGTPRTLSTIASMSVRERNSNDLGSSGTASSC